MRSRYIYILLSSALLIFITGCQQKTGGHAENPGIKAKELKEYHTFISSKNLAVGQPVRLKYDDSTGHVFIQDFAKSRIIEMDDSNKVVIVYSRKGRGPGESEFIENFFITNKHLFIVDGRLFLIDKYSRQDGHFISSMDYGKYLLKRKRSSKAPPPPPTVPFADMNNQPFVTLNETILLPSQNNGKFLYEELNWKGKKLADIGAIPKNYTASENVNKVWSILENRKVPAQDLCEAFPVNDPSDPNDVYLVYSAIPKIAKYSLSGKELWERKIPRTPEIDSLMIMLGNFARVVMNHPNTRVAPIPVRKYVTGRCSPAGDLYLVTGMDLMQMPDKYHRPLWIHQFDSKGKLIKRYKIVSDVDLSNYPGIDYKRHRIFVALFFFKNIGIRIYPF